MMKVSMPAKLTASRLQYDSFEGIVDGSGGTVDENDSAVGCIAFVYKSRLSAPVVNTG